MSGWEVTILCMFGIQFGISVAKHGESSGEYNCILTLCSIALWSFVMYNAGLFH